MPNILILGGTTEASALAVEVAAKNIPAMLSYAGRTAQPRAQPVPVRVGGFGGIEALAGYLRDEAITHLVDATHPFAAQMSAHAVAAAHMARVPLIALTRPPWRAEARDCWTKVPDLDAAVAALDRPAARVMLALGRMHVDAFAAQPHHRYLLRFVDRPAAAPLLPRYDIVIDRGPFTVAGDVALMRAHGVDLVLCKNAGGSGAAAKLVAARTLGLPVIMIDRPVRPSGLAVDTVTAVLDWIDHDAHRGV